MKVTVSLVAIALLVAFTGLAQAEPLNAKHVAADAKWLMHVDFDSARSSELAKEIHEKLMSHDKAKEHLQKVIEETGVDPRKDLHSATLYGTSFKPHTGVLVASAQGDKEKFLAHLKKKPDYKAVSEDGHELHSWTEHKGKKGEHTAYAASPKEGMMAFARSAAEVKAALAVILGKSASLGSDSRLAADVPAGAILVARAAGMAKADLPTKSPVLRGSDELSVAFGETKGEIFLTSRLVTASAEDAKKVVSVVEGFRAMGELRYSDDQDSLKIVKALKIEAADKVVEAEWRAPTKDILEMAQREKAKQQEMKKKREADKAGAEK